MNILLNKSKAVVSAFETKGTFFINQSGNIEGKHNYTGSHILKIYYDNGVVKIESKEGTETIRRPSKLRDTTSKKTNKSDKREESKPSASIGDMAD